MATRKQEEEAKALNESIAKDGLYAAVEGDDNSVAVSDPGFVGVSPEYANYANETDKPLYSEDEDTAKREQEAKEAELATAATATKVGFRGYEPSTPHPSERRAPAQDYIDANRAAMGLSAPAPADGEGDDGDDDATTEGAGSGTAPLGS